ncbi:D-alanyl-D-alanine carboxypeptidase DacA [Xenorhabdus kozodoii]|uniref:serine-type D-Ala-D-Ala carboxypeptidase n=1 Tax=Xenorhabdus kozodoii TaxID=351676 RepID=A0A2D0LE12_9GAMM|nr:D-alanyl-D-alanine carboxypeptidase DacA [Xenorhabdus kozodoii]PHM70691.1 D-alanyl-D-alanine endopeptidase [Xenorhabdus kozodoii]PHM73928.1 D-alanyl-D-alanine endopeptidase [Xenorhabdus kozodoii]
MKYIVTSRLIKNATLGIALAASVSVSANADDNFKTMIPGVPELDSEAYILIDYNSGKVLAEKSADVRRDPASLTKMMTSYVIGQAIKSGKIKPDDIVTVGKDAWATGNPIFKGSSLMFLKPGDQVSVAMLSRGINLQSGNDACVAMADYVAGSQDAFVSLMNQYVQSLGLKNTHFQTVHGLDANGQYSSAHDMALIGRALIRDVPDEYAIYKEKDFTYNNIHQPNRNGLLWDKSLSVDGIKTGHTSGAGYNLVASATEGNMRLISAVMGSPTSRGRETDSKKLLTWGFRFFETVSPLQVGKEFASEPIWFGDTDKVQLGVEQDVYLTIPRGRLKDLKASYVLDNTELHAPLAKNQVVGTINFQLDGKTIEQRPLVVMQEVKEGGFFSRLIDYIRLMFHHWFG